MGGCITEDYKDIVHGLIDQETAKEIVLAVVTAIPLCKDVVGAPAKAVAEAKARKVPTPWGIEPVYIDKGGKRTTFSSPSALVKHLDLPMSGIQCDTEGKTCKALSVVDILRVHGYTVTANGEPKKAAEGGTKMMVIHPEAPKKKE